MDKAIIELQKYKNILLNEAAIGGYISDTKSIDEALAELLEIQAKLESLREYCREQVDNINKIGDLDIIDVMKRTIYKDMLNKLEEEGKAQ